MRVCVPLAWPKRDDSVGPSTQAHVRCKRDLGCFGWSLVTVETFPRSHSVSPSVDAVPVHGTQSELFSAASSSGHAKTGRLCRPFYSSAGFGEVQRRSVGFEVGWVLREFQRKLKCFEVFVQHMFVNRLRPVRPIRDDLVGPNTLLLCSTDVRCEGIFASSLVPGHCGNASSVPFCFNGRCFSSGDQHRSQNGTALSTVDLSLLLDLESFGFCKCWS